MNIARAKGWKVEGQVERGESGTQHLQLCLRTPQVRFSAVKGTFQRAHIEVARNVAALRNYVAKEETKESDLPEQDNKYPSLSKMWELIFELFHTHDKEGWDECALYDGEIRFYRDADQERLLCDPLAVLGDAAAHLIKQGYFVEHHVCNPCVRSQWKHFHSEILLRSFNNISARQKLLETDRQTDTPHLNVPMLDTDINNAHDNAREEAGLQEVGGSPSNEGSDRDSEGSSPSSLGTDSGCSESDCEETDRSEE